MQSRSKYSTQLTHSRYTYKPSGPVLEGVSFPYTGIESFTVLSDTNTGDRNDVHPHSFRKNIIWDFVGSFEANYPSLDISTTGNIGSNTYTESVSGDFNNLYNDCLSSIYDQYRSGGVGSGLDLSVDIAESRQVLQLVKQIGTLSTYLRNFHPATWARRWLTLQYGVKPLMSSAYGTFDAIMNRRLFNYSRLVGRAKEVVDVRKTYVDNLYVPSKILHRGQTRRRAILVCEYKIANTVVDQLSGYTSLNPASLAWELLPYSFVVDWVYDIGGYLRNLEGALLARNSFQRGFGVYGYKSDQEMLLSGGSNSPSNTFAVSGKGWSRQTYKQRFKITSSPFPFSPSFRKSLGSYQLLSAASLLEVYRSKKYS